MKPLITIETVPIEIKFVKKEPQKLSTVNTTQVSVAQEDGRQNIRSSPIQIPMQDYFEPSSTYNWDHPTYTATADYSEDGNLNLNIRMEDGDAKAIRFEQSTRDINSIAGRIPTTAQGGNSEPGNMEISFNMSGFSSSTSKSGNADTQFYPPDLELVVTQQPKVIIKYVGGPIYVPLSADPDYKPVEGAGPMYFPESADPNYKPAEGSEDVSKIGEGLKLDQRV